MNFSFIRGILAGLLVGSILAAFVFAYFGLSQKIGIQDPPMGDKTSAAADIEKVVEAHEDTKRSCKRYRDTEEQDQVIHDADAESAIVEDANIGRKCRRYRLVHTKWKARKEDARFPKGDP